MRRVDLVSDDGDDPDVKWAKRVARNRLEMAEDDEEDRRRPSQRRIQVAFDEIGSSPLAGAAHTHTHPSGAPQE